MGQLFDLILIGGGTAALSAVSEALDIGVSSIVLIEKQQELGGECAFNACVPTKILLTAAKLAREMRMQGPEYGFEDIRYRFNFQKLMSTEEAIIHEGDYPFLKDSRVTVLQGTASFISPDTVQVGNRQIQGRKIIIATGSEPVIPGIEGMEEMGYITYQQATHLETLPESLLIVGGGPVGVEFAQLFQCLGIQVTLLQKGNHLIEHEEPEISDRIKAVLERDGVNVQTGCNIDAARCEIRKHQGKQLKCLRTDTNGQEALFSAEEILVAAGMKPRLNALNLEAAGVQANRHGIQVNGELQTSNPNIWAIGDVVGPYQFTHVADYQAVIAVHNALKDAHEIVDYRGLGWAVFTEPTVAHVGLTEVEARKEYGNIDMIQSSTHEVSRYRIESEPEGMIKLVIDTKTQQVVGAHLLASNAGDIAHMLMLAIRNHMTVRQLLDVIYIYPAKAQLIQKALEKYSQGKRKVALGV